MSSFSGSVCLLVLLGVVSVFGSPVSYVHDNLKQTHDAIAGVLVGLSTVLTLGQERVHTLEGV